MFDHAQSVFYVGDLAAKRGEEARAEDAYRTYLVLARRLAAIDPANDDWRMEHVYAQSALGSLYLDQGREAEAATAFADALAVAAVIVRRHPANTDQAMDLGQCHAWLADALEKQGKLAQARAHRLTEIDIYRAILARDPTFAGAKFHTLVALRKLARLAMLGGDTAAAVGGYADAAARAEALLAAQPDNMDLTGEASVAEIDLGEALLASSRLRRGRRARPARRRAGRRRPASRPIGAGLAGLPCPLAPVGGRHRGARRRAGQGAGSRSGHLEGGRRQPNGGRQHRATLAHRSRPLADRR